MKLNAWVFTIIVFSIPVFSTSVKAAGGSNEITLGAGTLQLASKASSITISPGYYKSLKEWIQVGGELGLNRLKFETTSVLMLQFFLGTMINIGPQASAYFVLAGAAYRTGSVSVDAVEGAAASTTATAASSTSTSNSADTTIEDPSGFGFSFFIGKRFPIAGSLAFRPNIGVVQAGTMGFVLNLMSLSYTF